MHVHGWRVQNLALAQRVQDLAAKKGCTAGQLALAWVQQQGNDVIPIPGEQYIWPDSIAISPDNISVVEPFASRVYVTVVVKLLGTLS